MRAAPRRVARAKLAHPRALRAKIKCTISNRATHHTKGVFSHIALVGLAVRHARRFLTVCRRRIPLRCVSCRVRARRRPAESWPCGGDVSRIARTTTPSHVAASAAVPLRRYCRRPAAAAPTETAPRAARIAAADGDTRRRRSRPPPRASESRPRARKPPRDVNDERRAMALHVRVTRARN